MIKYQHIMSNNTYYSHIKIGSEFGLWKVIEDIYYEGIIAYVKCKCSCGIERNVNVSKLNTGRSKSCGCTAALTTSERNKITKRKGTLAKNGLKQCSKCLLIQSDNQFDSNKNYEDGFTSLCKSCRRDTRIRKKYGINAKLFNYILKEQNYKCPICEKTEEEFGNSIEFCVDHNHSLPFPHARGILCSLCNKALGALFDSKKYAINLINYLDKSEIMIYTGIGKQSPLSKYESLVSLAVKHNFITIVGIWYELVFLQETNALLTNISRNRKIPKFQGEDNVWKFLEDNKKIREYLEQKIFKINSITSESIYYYNI